MHSQNTNHEKFMKIALSLAKLSKPSPNPRVGCVIVSDGNIIGVGFHKRSGLPHAEIEAINDAIKNGFSSKLKGSTFYITLEPCSIYGKTPPCVDRLISIAPKQVVIGCLDKNPKINGKSVNKLSLAGIKVIVSVMEKEAIELNK